MRDVTACVPPTLHIERYVAGSSDGSETRHGRQAFGTGWDEDICRRKVIRAHELRRVFLLRLPRRQRKKSPTQHGSPASWLHREVSSLGCLYTPKWKFGDKHGKRALLSRRGVVLIDSRKPCAFDAAAFTSPHRSPRFALL